MNHQRHRIAKYLSAIYLDQWVTIAIIALFLWNIYWVIMEKYPIAHTLYAYIAGITVVIINQLLAKEVIAKRQDNRDFIRWLLSLLIDTSIGFYLHLSLPVFTAIWFILTLTAIIDNVGTFRVYIGNIAVLIYAIYSLLVFQVIIEPILLTILLYCLTRIVRRDVVSLENQILLLQEEFTQKEKLATVGMVTTGLAHQVGNTLNIISVSMMAFQRLLKNSHIDNKQAFELTIQRNKEAIELSKTIINNIDFATKNNQERHIDSIYSIAESAIHLMKGVSLEKIQAVNNIDPALQFPVYKGSLLQIFMILIKNSTQALEGVYDGFFSIDAKLISPEKLEIIFYDNGPGISENIINNLFKPFNTSKNDNDGSGLGLYLLNIEVKRHKGQVNYHYNKGASFTFTFEK